MPLWTTTLLRNREELTLRKKEKRLRESHQKESEEHSGIKSQRRLSYYLRKVGRREGDETTILRQCLSFVRNKLMCEEEHLIPDTRLKHVEIGNTLEFLSIIELIQRTLQSINSPNQSSTFSEINILKNFEFPTSRQLFHFKNQK